MHQLHQSDGFEQLDALPFLTCGYVIEYRPGNMITFDGPNLHLVITGLVKVMERGEDGDIFIDLCCTDDFMGAMSFAGAALGNEYGIALNKVRLMWWFRDKIVEVIAREPKLGIALWQSTLRQEQRLRDRIALLSDPHPGRRIANALVALGKRFGVRDNTSQAVPRPLTRSLIAEFVGLAPSTVTRWLRIFREAGLIQERNLIFDPLKLQKEARKFASD